MSTWGRERWRGVLALRTNSCTSSIGSVPLSVPLFPRSVGYNYCYGATVVRSVNPAGALLTPLW